MYRLHLPQRLHCMQGSQVTGGCCLDTLFHYATVSDHTVQGHSIAADTDFLMQQLYTKRYFQV